RGGPTSTPSSGSCSGGAWRRRRRERSAVRGEQAPGLQVVDLAPGDGEDVLPGRLGAGAAGLPGGAGDVGGAPVRTDLVEAPAPELVPVLHPEPAAGAEALEAGLHQHVPGDADAGVHLLPVDAVGVLGRDPLQVGVVPQAESGAAGGGVVEAEVAAVA